MAWYRRVAVVACLALASGSTAAVVLDPVPHPILPGLTVALKPVARLADDGGPRVGGYTSRLQSLRALPDGRTFVTDTRGLISLVDPATGTTRPWLDVRNALPGFSNATNLTQTGLMSVAFHPNFAGDPRAPGYGVFYTIDTSRPSSSATLRGNGPAVDHDNVLHEFRVVDPAAAIPAIAPPREVLRAAQPLSDHGPGTIGFNPTATPGDADYGKLYIGLGDGGGVGDPYANAQDPGSPFGKILRIDPAVGATGEPYTIPADNPHIGQPGALGEVWASGLRNPQQFSWDVDTGQMLIADMGQAQLDEVNVGAAGANYGWPAREGTFARGTADDPNVYDTPPNSGFADPVAQFDHEELLRTSGFTLTAIGGVFAYRGDAIPALEGMIVLSELVSGRLFYYDPLDLLAQPTALLRELLLTLDGSPIDLRALAGNPYLGGRVDLRLGQDGDGELYLLGKSFGDIFTLAAIPEPETWVQLTFGIGLIGIWQRRSKRRRATLA